MYLLKNLFGVIFYNKEKLQTADLSMSVKLIWLHINSDQKTFSTDFRTEQLFTRTAALLFEGLAPSYLSELILPHVPACALRSSSDHLLAVPKFWLPSVSEGFSAFLLPSSGINYHKVSLLSPHSRPLKLPSKLTYLQNVFLIDCLP